MENNVARKKRVMINAEVFNQIKRLYKSRSKLEIMEITSLSKNAVNEAIRKIENCECSEPQFETLYKKVGRKKLNKESLHNEIRNIMGNDNSLTQKGCQEKLSINISTTKLCREIKLAGLTRKRLKKRPSVRLTEENIDQRQIFCAQILGIKNKQIYFLDESGFNLHTSINYGYSMANQEAIMYQPASRGRNISLCAMISSSGVEKFEMIDGSYSRETFMKFLVCCSNAGLFRNNPVLIMDNVRFHHCFEIKEYLQSQNVILNFLPPYSPDLNPIENVFASIKSRLDSIRPRSLNREILKINMQTVITQLGNFNEYYRKFWEIIHSINNRQL